MQKLIDTLTDVTGWQANYAHLGLISHKEYCANNMDTALVVEFDEGGYITKDYNGIDVSGYDELVLSIWSRNKGKYYYATYQDYNYSITVNDKKYFVPAFKTLEQIHIPLTGIDAINTITIRNETAGRDTIVISYAVACGRRDEVIKDILDGVAEALYEAMGDTKIFITYIDTVKGEDLIVPNDAYIGPNTVIVITDGTHTEKHKVVSVVMDSSTGKCKLVLGKDYDGSAIQNTMTQASLYLTCEIIYNIREDTVVIPGIALWSRLPVENMKTSGLTEMVAAVTTDGYYLRREPVEYECEIMIDCISRSYDVLFRLNEAVRRFIGGRTVWIQGKQFEIESIGEPILIEQTQPYQVIPKTQHTAKLKLALDMWDITKYAVCTTINMEVK